MLGRPGRLIVVLVVTGLTSPCVASAQTDPAGILEARIWIDRGMEPVLQEGEGVRVYFRVSHAAYLTVFHIDTSGRVRLVLPHGREQERPARAKADYRLLFPDGAHWVVRDEPGVGYFFVVASNVPFDLGAFEFRDRVGWDLSTVQQRVRQDPFVAMEGLIEAVRPAGEHVERALDFVQYRVGNRYSYPRFLCYDCHVPESRAVQNPYHDLCPSVRVVINNDPYFYPATRYRGERVVQPRMPDRGQFKYSIRERGRGEPGTPVVQAREGAGFSPPAGGEQPDRSTAGERRIELPSAISPGDASALGNRGDSAGDPMDSTMVPLREQRPDSGSDRPRPTLERRRPPPLRPGTLQGGG